jgi:transcription elongation factor Elf1
MPLIGPVPQGGTFFCPHCGALYSVTHARRPKSDNKIAKCLVCAQTMDERDPTKVPI